MKTISMDKLPSVSRAQMAKVDCLMIAEYGISLLQMMENAGRNLADLSQSILADEWREKRIAVLCGGGNNGGGGLAAARHLANRGSKIKIALAVETENIKSIPKQQINTLRRMGARISESFPEEPCDLIIDALIGYGLRGVPRGKIAEWISRTNRKGCHILSLDVPSGFDADKGKVQDIVVRADSTMTLALPKKGMLQASAWETLGDLYAADISVPSTLYQEMGLPAIDLFSDGAIVRIARSKEGGL